MKKELLNISEDEVKPYFNVGQRAYQWCILCCQPRLRLTFKERTDIPLYHLT
ncbi:hypothetical protein [Prevotella communis]|uniref:hypothetical protein n=1 Tax=Prevotella communis TaxID=2913614 RepID=UPI0032AF4D45